MAVGQFPDKERKCTLQGDRITGAQQHSRMGGVAGAGSWKEYGLMSGLRKEIATVTTMTKR